MDGLVAENDVHPVVEIPEVVLGRRQLAAVVLWVIPVVLEKGWKDSLRYGLCCNDGKTEISVTEGSVSEVKVEVKDRKRRSRSK